MRRGTLQAPAIDAQENVRCGKGDAFVAIHEAKTNLSKIVEEVAAGAEVIIAKAGKPMARLSPLEAVPQPKMLGLLKGQIKVPDDFNASLDDEVLADFEGR